MKYFNAKTTRFEIPLISQSLSELQTKIKTVIFSPKFIQKINSKFEQAWKGTIGHFNQNVPQSQRLDHFPLSTNQTHFDLLGLPGNSHNNLEIRHQNIIIRLTKGPSTNRTYSLYEDYLISRFILKRPKSAGEGALGLLSDYLGRAAHKIKYHIADLRKSAIEESVWETVEELVLRHFKEHTEHLKLSYTARSVFAVQRNLPYSIRFSMAIDLFLIEFCVACGVERFYVQESFVFGLFALLRSRSTFQIDGLLPETELSDQSMCDRAASNRTYFYKKFEFERQVREFEELIVGSNFLTKIQQPNWRKLLNYGRESPGNSGKGPAKQSQKTIERKPSGLSLISAPQVLLFDSGSKLIQSQSVRLGNSVLNAFDQKIVSFALVTLKKMGIMLNVHRRLSELVASVPDSIGDYLSYLDEFVVLFEQIIEKNVKPGFLDNFKCILNKILEQKHAIKNNI